MNIGSRLGCLAVVYMIHYEYPVFLDQPAIVAWTDADSPPPKAEFSPETGSARSTAFRTPTWEQLEPRVMLSPNHPLDVTIQRGTDFLHKTIIPDASKVSQIGYAGWDPIQPITITQMTKRHARRKGWTARGR